MCGIVAVIGNISVKEETIFKQLLEVDSLRGRHSTGVIKVTNDKVVSTKKKAVDGVDFVKLESKWIGQGTNRVLIGHNRWATKGAVNDVNAHPFSHGHIHGVHNGTLTTQFGLKDHTKFEVDSDNIFYNIEHEGVDKTVEKLKGAFAIAMYDDKECQVNIFRNSERELGMAILNGGRTIILASEYMMLKWVLDRNDIDESEYQLIELINVYNKITLKPFELDKNKILKPIGKTVEISKLKKPTVVVSNTSKPLVPLSKYGLNGRDYYPCEILSKEKVASNHVQYLLEMAVQPYSKVTLNVYGEANHKKVDDMFATQDKMLETRVNPAYSYSNTIKGSDFLAYSCDFRPLSVAGRAMIEAELQHEADIDKALAELDALDEDNIVPFQGGKTKKKK